MIQMVQQFVPKSIKRAIRIGFASSLPLNGRLQLLAVERRQKRAGRHDDTAIDLGAHCGYFGAYALRKGRRVRVFL
jgi:hypothetical protein